METLVKTHAGSTDRHQRVLDCIIACRSKPPEEEERKKRGRKREDREDRTEKNGSKDPEEKSWQDSERWDLSESLSFRGENVYERCVVLLTFRLKGLLDKDDQESEVIKDSPDSPEPLNKKPRLSREEDQPPDRAKGTNRDSVLQFNTTRSTHRALNLPQAPSRSSPCGPTASPLPIPGSIRSLLDG